MREQLEQLRLRSEKWTTYSWVTFLLYGAAIVLAYVYDTWPATAALVASVVVFICVYWHALSLRARYYKGVSEQVDAAVDKAVEDVLTKILGESTRKAGQDELDG